jgi:hypothetical protein
MPPPGPSSVPIASSLSEWVLWFLANVGGTAVVLGALFAWLGRRYLDREKAKDELKNNSALEERKTVQQKHILVYRAQFEVEFRAYRRIWSTCSDLMDHVARLVHLYQQVELPGQSGTKAGIRNQADAALQAAITASERQAPFISAEVRDTATVFIAAARAEVEAFSGALAAEEHRRNDYFPEQAFEEAKAGCAMAKSKWNRLEAVIRDRTTKLSIIDA